MSRDSIEKPENRSTSSPTHIVILGSGFAGIEEWVPLAMTS